jgi:hypothetical protein
VKWADLMQAISPVYRCDRPRIVTVERGPKREKWWDGCGSLVSLDSKLTKIQANKGQRRSSTDSIWDEGC